jgi:hypothetical protein
LSEETVGFKLKPTTAGSHKVLEGSRRRVQSGISELPRARLDIDHRSSGRVLEDGSQRRVQRKGDDNEVPELPRARHSRTLEDRPCRLELTEDGQKDQEVMETESRRRAPSGISELPRVQHNVDPSLRGRTLENGSQRSERSEGDDCGLSELPRVRREVDKRSRRRTLENRSRQLDLIKDGQGDAEEPVIPVCLSQNNPELSCDSMQIIKPAQDRSTSPKRRRRGEIDHRSPSNEGTPMQPRMDTKPKQVSFASPEGWTPRRPMSCSLRQRQGTKRG